MLEFLWLIGAHFIGDYGLQNQCMADNKGEDWYDKLAHCAIWATCICATLALLDALEWWHPLFLVCLHGVADTTKQRLHRAKWMIYVDQLWHFAQLAVVYYAH